MDDERAWRAVVSVVLATAAIIGVWIGGVGRGPPPSPLASGEQLPTGWSLAEPVVSTVTGGPASRPDQITVHVAGWVVSPGLVRLDHDARVADAVAAAGGAMAGAGMSQVNLAAPVADGQQVVIPAPSTAGAAEEVHPAVTGDGRIRINAATAKDLESLPGVGPVLAARIVDHRQQIGRFESVEDLLDVSGIGESKLMAMRDRIAIP